MRVIVTGSRYWSDKLTIRNRLAQLPSGSTVIHGDCPLGGADMIADVFAQDLGFIVEKFPAKRILWQTFAQAAKARNQAMADAGADLCLAFPLPGSRGTWDMVRRAKAAGIPVEIIRARPAERAKEEP